MVQLKPIIASPLLLILALTSSNSSLADESIITTEQPENQEIISKLSKNCEKCLLEFHEKTKQTLIKAEHNKTLKECLTKALYINDVPENSEIRDCLENSDFD